MSYTALYRKFRPDAFLDVKGQEHIVTTLKNQIKADRIGHAYLFCGTRGTGKTTIAKILARAVNCQQPVEGSPCNECDSCKAILSGASMNVIEIDAASNNGVDNIREIREEVAYRPAQGRFKVYIIDEVHMLSAGAFNALLKTLEEPPSYVIFILATTEVHKIPVTILSRCQRYDFKRITIDIISDRLLDLMAKEQVQAEAKAIQYIARAADGSMRDALSLLDQCIAFYMGEDLTYDKVLDILGAVDTEVFSKLLRRIIDNDVTGAIHVLEELITRGRDMGQFVIDFIWYMRNLLLIKTSGSIEEVLDVSTENRKLLEEESQMLEEETLMRYIRIFSQLSNQIRYSTQKRVLVEIAIIKLCKPVMETDMESILERVRALEGKIEKGIPMPKQTEQIEKAVQTPIQPKPKPPRAAPEDLQYIKKNWKSMVGETTGLLQQMLKEAIPKYNGNTGEGKLYVEFQNFLAQSCIDNPESKEKLEEIIVRKLGKTVEIELLMAQKNKETHSGLEEIAIDDMLKKNVHMDIVVEDIPQDE